MQREGSRPRPRLICDPTDLGVTLWGPSEGELRGGLPLTQVLLQGGDSSFRGQLPDFFGVQPRDLHCCHHRRAQRGGRPGRPISRRFFGVCRLPPGESRSWNTCTKLHNSSVSENVSCFPSTLPTGGPRPSARGVCRAPREEPTLRSAFLGLAAQRSSSFLFRESQATGRAPSIRRLKLCWAVVRRFRQMPCCPRHRHINKLEEVPCPDLGQLSPGSSWPGAQRSGSVL